MRNFVYWNIHDRMFTVQNRLTGRVRRHAESLTLEDVDFEIDRGERDRMLRTGRKTLHAGLRGEIVELEPDVHGWVRVVYDPAVHESFVSAEDGRPVVRAELVRLEVREGTAYVYAKGVTYGGT